MHYLVYLTTANSLHDAAKYAVVMRAPVRVTQLRDLAPHASESYERPPAWYITASDRQYRSFHPQLARSASVALQVWNCLLRSYARL